MVCSTSTPTARFSQPSSSSTNSVKGTKVMSATSLVTAMEVKKGSSTSATPRPRPPKRLKSRCESTSNTPQDWKPATTAIRHSSRHSTLTSIYPMYAASGGTKNIVMTAHSAATHKTVSLLKNSQALFPMISLLPSVKSA